MIRCWLVHSMRGEIVEDFSYVEPSQELWEELLDWFEVSNAPLVNQLHKDLGTLKQDNLSVIDYFNKIKK